MSYLETKGTISMFYEGKSNYVHTFWCAFYFLPESYPCEGKLPKYPLLF